MTTADQIDLDLKNELDISKKVAIHTLQATVVEIFIARVLRWMLKATLS